MPTDAGAINRWTVLLLSFLPERFPVSLRLIHFHWLFAHDGLDKFEKFTEISFLFVRYPVRSWFGTFVGRKLVIILTVLTTMDRGRTIWTKLKEGGVGGNLPVTPIAQ